MATTLYVAMIADRHTDPEPYLFETAEQAIAYAQAKAREYALSPETVEEEPVEGWLYRATYSTEGDAVWVLAKTVGEAP
jgi:hypothetical protein